MPVRHSVGSDDVWAEQADRKKQSDTTVSSRRVPLIFKQLVLGKGRWPGYLHADAVHIFFRTVRSAWTTWTIVTTPQVAPAAAAGNSPAREISRCTHRKLLP